MTRLAIVLRGVPNAGKSTVSDGLQGYLGLRPKSQVSLDDGWGAGERRSNPATRYSELLEQPNVLLIELGYGDLATTNPREWLDILERESRLVVFVLLDVSKRECLKREATRKKLPLSYAEAAWNRYDSGVCRSSSFFALAGKYSETRIETDQTDLATTLSRILAAIVVGVSAAQPRVAADGACAPPLNA
jgi:hypothetical protein